MYSLLPVHIDYIHGDLKPRYMRDTFLRRKRLIEHMPSTFDYVAIL